MRQLNCVLCFFAIVLIPSTAFSQSACDEVKKENEYLRKALKITTPVKTATSLNIDFNIIKVEGNKKEQTVTLTLTIVNHDPNQRVSFDRAQAIDAEGNEYPTDDTHIGSSWRANTAYTETPIKATIVFKKVLPSTQLFKLVAVDYFHEKHSSTIKFEYRDLTIDWK
ncbi:hypothetical protein [Filimonas effusa]|uniref:DUF4352 domain-containing protein n=1 Tax=Filimonas effusa TaxID=2508721 RepID=A0A4V1M9G7_9BACT|nr:hypothetical protein [Filimonas effusa]RXK81042.1 hypothetical protein ESB13_23090 [Filimonas effusa]